MVKDDFKFYSTDFLSNRLELELINENFELVSEINDEINLREITYVKTMSLESQINIIINSIGLERIHLVMENLNWCWRFSGVPTIDELKTEAISMLKEVWDCDEHLSHELAISGGGFKVTRLIYDGVKSLKLEFILSDFMIDEDILLMTEEEFYRVNNEE